MGKRKCGNSSYNANKRRRKHVLETGMRGFLCTCNAKEKECIREAYNILNDYADKLYGEEQFDDDKDEAVDETEIEDELKKEVESLKTTNKNIKERRFQVIDSGANNCIFIKTTLPEPIELVNSVTNDVYKTHKQISRYVMRLLPIEITCKAYLDDIKKECEKLFEKHFKCEPTTYGIAYNKRYNDNLLRSEVIESLARLIQDRNILHKVDLRQAKKTVIVEIIKNICCISVIPDYYQLKKYNLAELSKKEVEEINSNNVKNDESKIIIDNDKIFKLSEEKNTEVEVKTSDVSKNDKLSEEKNTEDEVKTSDVSKNDKLSEEKNTEDEVKTSDVSKNDKLSEEKNTEVEVKTSGVSKNDKLSEEKNTEVEVKTSDVSNNDNHVK
ncbi:THUMP domain-containing protein 1 homolog [Lycorma delicatula]|uniref:THUMP domain-containing protein 1 homolog n=1 Tax=Lycorma delicatula TaxID=130591 RepID=UPI003F518393